MKLYYMPGACSLATRISLHEIDEPFDAIRVDKATKTTSEGEDFLSINPLGYVPVIEFDNGGVLTENAAILSYFAELDPMKLGGTDPFQRARVNEALSFLSSELHKAFGPLFHGAQGDDRDKAIAALNVRIDHVERMLADGREFLLGSDFTAADAYAFVILNWAGMLGLSLADWANTQAYVFRMARRPSVAQALQEEGLMKAAA